MTGIPLPRLMALLLSFCLLCLSPLALASQEVTLPPDDEVGSDVDDVVTHSQVQPAEEALSDGSHLVSSPAQLDAIDPGIFREQERRANCVLDTGCLHRWSFAEPPYADDDTRPLVNEAVATVTSDWNREVWEPIDHSRAVE